MLNMKTFFCPPLLIYFLTLNQLFRKLKKKTEENHAKFSDLFVVSKKRTLIDFIYIFTRTFDESFIRTLEYIGYGYIKCVEWYNSRSVSCGISCVNMRTTMERV